VAPHGRNPIAKGQPSCGPSEWHRQDAHPCAPEGGGFRVGEETNSCMIDRARPGALRARLDRAMRSM